MMSRYSVWQRIAAVTLALSFFVGYLPSKIAAVTSAEENVDDIVGEMEYVTSGGTDSVGNLISDALNEKSSEQKENFGFNVFSVEMQGNTAVVDYEVLIDSTLVVGIYDDSGERLLATGKTDVTAEETQTQVIIDSIDIPQFFYIKAYLINPETLRPLCEVYECPTYTQEMQEFLSKTVNDFEPELVLNLDEDETNNFLVFDEDTIFSEETANVNKVVSIDEEDEIYVIENADDTVKGLQQGDVFSLEYNENELLIISVKNIDVIDNTVTIYGNDSSIEDIFEYVKIDSSFTSADAVADVESLGEGTQYAFKGGISTFAVSSEGSAEYSHSFKFTDKNIENYSDSTSSANVKLNGSLDLKIGGKVKLYISWSETYIELRIDYSAKLYLTFSEKLNGKIPLAHFEISPFAGVFIRINPAIEVELEGKISLEGKLSGCFGFKASTASGANNISSAPKFEHELSAEGRFYVGFTLDPKVVILSEKVANAGITGKMGVEVRADLTYGSTDEKNGIRHDCKSCIDGDISIKYNISASISILDDCVSFKLTLLDKTVKLTDFYRSDDFGDSGFSECPHLSYRVNGKVFDDKNNPHTNALVKLKDGTIYATDSEGKVEFYLPKGSYYFEVYDDKYIYNSYNIIKNKGIEFSAWLSPLFCISDTDIKPDDGSGGNSGNTPDNPDDNTDNDSSDVYEATPAEYFEYTISDNEVTITDYIGSDTEVIIPDTIEGLPVTSIGYSAFQYCNSLTSITIPDSVTSIGGSAFSGCDSLTSITIPDSVTSIGNYAFSSCYDLTSITIPDSVTSIGNWAFQDCHSLTSITIPDSVTSIGDCAFHSCDGLTSITIPDSVTSIGSHAFYDCASLTSITIPDSVTSIGDGVFLSCESLESINVADNNANYKSVDGVLFNKDMSEIVTYLEGKTAKSYTIPDSVTSIGDYAFGDCGSLTNITIPDSVTYIGGHAFEGCTNLTSIIISDSVTSIGDNAFWSCDSLASITIPDSVTSIGDCAFGDCDSLTSITIPNSVTSIGYCAFGDCDSLASITIPDSVTSIGGYAFGDCYSLTSITIPNSVTYIGYRAFWNCYRLASITIPDSVTSIGNDAFSGCDRLTIYGYAGSYAETYATEQEIPFVVIDENTAVSYSVSYSMANYLSSESVDYKTFTGLLPNEIYNCYVMKDKDSDDPFGGENLLFIAQAVSDTDGTLMLNSVPDEGELFVKSMTDFSVTNAVINYAEVKSKSATFKWDAVPNAQKYRIYTVKDGVYTEHSATSDTSCTIDGLTKNTVYAVIVQTCIYGEWSELSEYDMVYFTTSLSGSVSGYITRLGSGGTITISLADSSGNIVEKIESTDGNYNFDNITQDEEYSVIITLSGYAPRQYSLTGSSDALTLDMEIRQYGDIHADGVVDAKDATQILRYEAGLPSVFDNNDEYIMAVANVVSSDELSAKDATQILRHEAGMTSIFDNLQ